MINGKFFFTLLLLLSGPWLLKAQMTDSGTEFFVSLVERGFPSYSIVSKHAATVSFHYFADSDSDTTFYLTPGEITYIGATFPDDFFASANIADHNIGEIDNRSMFICADSNITVLFQNARGAAEDAAIIYPVKQPNIYNYEYMTIGAGKSGFPFPENRSAIIISHFDSVLLEITPKYDVADYPGDEPFLINLNRGETFILGNLYKDQTGSSIRVISSTRPNPLTVLSSYPPSYIAYPWDSMPICCADYLMEQILPMDSWDSLYFFIPLLIAEGLEDETGSPSLGGIARVLSPYDSNTIKINGAEVASLMAGEFLDTILYEPAVISSTYPCIANQFIRSSILTEVPEYGDPDQLWLMSLKNGINHTIFKTMDNFITYFPSQITTLTMIADTGVNEVLLDGINIWDQFATFPSAPAYNYLQVWVDEERHELKADKSVIAYINTLAEVHGGASYNLPDLADGPMIDLGPDVQAVFACGPTTLTAKDAEDYSYLWNTGASTQSIDIEGDDGTYWVTYSLQLGCREFTDSFYVSQAVSVRPLAGDTLICKGDTVILDAYRDFFTSYLWNTGESEPVIQVTEPGLYSVALATEHCPQIMDTLIVFGPSVPESTLPNDSLLCMGTVVMLGQEVPDVNYYWSTGQTSCCIVAEQSGTYVRTLFNECEEAFPDTCSLRFIDCDQCLLIPTAFSPNGDGLNDKFTVVSDCILGAYRLDIYNRYGQRVFISYDPSDGWDGTFNGARLDVGVYFYYVQAEHILKDGNMIYKKGDLTLLR